MERRISSCNTSGSSRYAEAASANVSNGAMAHPTHAIRKRANTAAAAGQRVITFCTVHESSGNSSYILRLPSFIRGSGYDRREKSSLRWIKQQKNFFQVFKRLPEPAPVSRSRKSLDPIESSRVSKTKSIGVSEKVFPAVRLATKAKLYGKHVFTAFRGTFSIRRVRPSSRRSQPKHGVGER